MHHIGYRYYIDRDDDDRELILLHSCSGSARVFAAVATYDYDVPLGHVLADMDNAAAEHDQICSPSPNRTSAGVEL